MDVSDIKIVDAIETEKPDFDFEAKIPEILGKVPRMDLRGIKKIDLVGYARNQHEQDEISRFHPRHEGKPAYIELCVGRILDLMDEKEKKDEQAVYAAVCYAIFLAVGYNTLQFKHGISKDRHDSYARGYAKRNLAKACPGWKLEGELPKKA